MFSNSSQIGFWQITMRPQFLVIAAILSRAIAEQHPWLYRTKGKPTAMLEVGRLPALGCAFPLHVICWPQTILGMLTRVISMNQSSSRTLNSWRTLDCYKQDLITSLLTVHVALVSLTKFQTAGWLKSDQTQATCSLIHIASLQESSLLSTQSIPWVLNSVSMRVPGLSHANIFPGV